MMNGDLTRVRDVLSEDITVPYALPCVQQFSTRCGDAFNGVEECFAEHDVRQSALVHVEPNVLSDVNVSFVNEHHVRCANLHDCWFGRLHLCVVTVRQMQRFAVSPGGTASD